MSLVERLRLDDVISSFPELGPTVPDGGYSWIVLLGIIFIQITVPSVLSMYGIVLGYLAKNNGSEFDLWSAKITLTPILFTAFWSLTDPWTKMITDLASIPRLVGLIGVALLSSGVVASGYLATGGVGAYLASLSAGAVMGIGASFVIVQSEIVLRKYFRVKLPLALTLKSIAASFGFTFIPALTYFLLQQTGPKTGFLLMTIVFIPTALGTLILRLPPPQQAPPYRLLLPTDEDNELGTRVFPDITENSNHRQINGLDNAGYINSTDKQGENIPSVLFSEVNSIYTYEEQEDDDIELFVSPIAQIENKWKQELYVIRYFRFWAAVITWTGMRACSLFFWILIPTLYLQRAVSVYFSDWVMLSVAAGIGTFIPSISSCCSMTTTPQYRRICFGSTCWLGSIVLIGLTYANNYYWFMICSLLAGVSINSLLICQDLTLCDVLGKQLVHRSRKLFSIFVGLGILIFCFVHNANICLRMVAFLQFLGGCYWTVPPILKIIQTQRLRQN